MADLCEIPRWQLLKSQLINLNPSEFKRSIDREIDAILIDVRTMEEWMTGTLSGAIHLDYLDDGFLDRLEVLDRNKSYFIFCRTGRRSVRTAILMKNWNFKNLVNLDGGLVAWKKVFSDSSL